MKSIRHAFLAKPLMLKIADLLPSKQLHPKVFATPKYRQIRASIREIGLIEPLSVTPVDRESGCHKILDGHIRLHIVDELGHLEVACLVATDIEAFTYNRYVNRLSSVQEHLMIRRALDRGISVEKLSVALCINVSLLNKKGSLLEGICPEAAAMLENRTFSPDLPSALRRMKPARQIESVGLMIAANRVTLGCARALLVGTPPEMLAEGKRPLRSCALSPNQKANMEHEMSVLQADYKLAESTLGLDVLNLMLARAYVAKLIANARVRKYMVRQFPEVLEEFTRLVELESVDA